MPSSSASLTSLTLSAPLTALVVLIRKTTIAFFVDGKEPQESTKLPQDFEFYSRPVATQELLKVLCSCSEYA